MKPITTSTPMRAIAYTLRRALHPAFLSGVLLSAVGIAFNVSHGWHLGGSDMLRATGMAGVFLGCIALKDSLLGQIALAVKTRRLGLALVCLVGFALGATGSLIAAFGSASEGREEKADPRQAQITAFKTAEDSVRDADARLKELGRTGTAAETSAAASAELARIDAQIAKRTTGCTVLAPDGSGKRQIAVNRETCQPVIDALALVAKAKEADSLRKVRDTARDVVSKGAPKAADPLVANISALWAKVSGSKGDIDIGAILSLLVAVIVELGAPVSWAIWQLSFARGPSASAAAPAAADKTFSEIKAEALASERLPVPANYPALATFSSELPERLPENDPVPPGGGRKRKTSATLPANVIPFGKHPVIAALERNGGSVASNRQLASLMGVCDGEASKRWTEVADQLDVQKIGKRLAISLR